jgi:hypothetical protein
MRVNHNFAARNFVGIEPFLSNVSYDRIKIAPNVCVSCGPYFNIRIGYLLIIKISVQVIELSNTINSPLKSSKIFAPMGN